MAFEHMKACLTSLIILKMQIKITLRYFSPIRLAHIQHLKQLGKAYLTDGSAKWHNSFEGKLTKP